MQCENWVPIRAVTLTQPPLFFSIQVGQETTEDQIDAHPDVVRVNSFLAGNYTAICSHLIDFARRNPVGVRELTPVTARKVTANFCSHGEEALRCTEGNIRTSRASSIAADGECKDLCGRH